jgi:hypothetical protein
MTAAVLEDRRRCLTAGMDDRIAKPVLLAEVQMVLSRWLEGEVTTRQVAGPAAAAETTWEVLDQNRLSELGSLDTTGNGPALGWRPSSPGSALTIQMGDDTFSPVEPLAPRAQSRVGPPWRMPPSAVGASPGCISSVCP